MVLGRKKKEEKEEEELELEELEELLGEEEQVIPVKESEGPPGPQEMPASAPGPPPELDEIKVALKEIQERVSRLTSAVENLRRDIDTIRDDLREKDNQIRKLTSIYELVSQQINPFVEAPAQPPTKEKVEEKPEEVPIEEIVGALEEKAPEVPPTPVEEKREVKPAEVKVEEIPEKMKEKPTGILKPPKPILEKIPNDFISTTITLRWIGFLLERVDRKTLPLLLEYYKDIGWISDYAKRQLMAYARGVIQDVSYSEEELVAEFGGTTVKPEEEIKRTIEDWRLPAEDHIKSLIFIMRIKGEEIDKDLLNSIEMEIRKLRRSLEGYYGV